MDSADKDSQPASTADSPRRFRLLEAIGPGILVAATGVGAGDLAGGAIAGAKLKLDILWVVLVGASLKYVLCEGLARWQLQTSTSLPDGVFKATGTLCRTLFLAYVAVWSFCIGGMLMSACGECSQAILPLGSNATGRIIHGCLASLTAILLVRIGGFRLFERMMAVCIAVMFVTVVTVATLTATAWSDVARGLLLPRVPHAGGNGIAWALTLMAGVGGTLTMLCYGTWIREKDRTTAASIPLCRIDLGAGYLMTAVFGISMVILGSRLTVNADLKGVNLINDLASEMSVGVGQYGSIAAWMFRLGAWGAVFSSLLGVWQSVPALIEDMLPGKADALETESRTYNRILLAMGILPMLCLPFSLATIQKVAGVTGAAFMPMFALSLLLLPRSSRGREAGFCNGWFTTAILALSLLLFGFLAGQKIWQVLGG